MNLKSQLFLAPDVEAPTLAADFITKAKASMDQSFRKEGKPEPVKQPVEVKTVVTPPPGEKPPAPPVKPPDPTLTGPKGLRDEVEKRGARIKELEEKLATFEPAVKERDTFRSELETLRATFDKTATERDEFKKLQSVAALEQSPEFQTKYVQGRNTLETRLTQLSELAKIAPAELLAAAARTGADRYTALEEIIGSAPRLLQEKLMRTIDEIDNLDSARQQELQQAHELMQQRIAERETGDRRTKEERQKTIAAAWDATAPTLAKELGLNDAAVAAAKDIFFNNRDRTKGAQIVLQAQATPALQARIKELEAEVAGYQGATPGVRAGGHKPNGGADEKPAGMPLSVWMNELAKRAIGR